MHMRSLPLSPLTMLAFHRVCQPKQSQQLKTSIAASCRIILELAWLVIPDWSHLSDHAGVTEQVQHLSRFRLKHLPQFLPLLSPRAPTVCTPSRAATLELCVFPESIFTLNSHLKVIFTIYMKCDALWAQEDLPNITALEIEPWWIDRGVSFVFWGIDDQLIQFIPRRHFHQLS